MRGTDDTRSGLSAIAPPVSTTHLVLRVLRRPGGTAATLVDTLVVAVAASRSCHVLQSPARFRWVWTGAVLFERWSSTPVSGSARSSDAGEPRRIVRVAEVFAAQRSGRPEERLCAAALKLLDAAAVAVSVGASDELVDSGLQTVHATGEGWHGEARQFDLGEGPSYTAHRTGWPVQVPDLELDESWPAFAEAAAALGFRAVFAFPLRSGSVGLGALTLYQRVAGELTAEQYADALVIARFALNLLTSLQAGRPADELDQVFTDTLTNAVEVHQASGVVSVQLGISVGAALALLRAHAFAEVASLPEIATQVIEHRLQLGPLHA